MRSERRRNEGKTLYIKRQGWEPIPEKYKANKSMRT
jgi:hypothetical protein